MKTRLIKALLIIAAILTSIAALLFCTLLLINLFGETYSVLPPGDDPATKPVDILDLSIDTTRSDPGDKPPMVEVIRTASRSSSARWLGEKRLEVSVEP